MSKGKRYDAKPELNVKKVYGVVIAIIVLIMVMFSITKALKNNDELEKNINVSYYTIYYNNKFGVMDNEGKTIIEPIYDEMIVIPNKEKAVFICTYDVNDTDGTYKTKVINEKSEELLKNYEKVEVIDNYDSKQNIWYEENTLRVLKDGKYGLINLDGKLLLPCEYTQISSLISVKNNILVKKDGKTGLVNEEGQFIIPTEYNNILIMEEGYKDEYIIVNNEGKYGVISTSSKIILEPKYENVKYLNTKDKFAVSEDGILKLIDNSGKVLLEKGYDNIIQAKGENVIIIKDNKYGVINLKSEQKIPTEYDELKYANSIYYIAKKDNKYGVIDIDNKEIIPFEYMNINYILELDLAIGDKIETETVVFDNNWSQKLTGIVSEINKEKGYIKISINNEYKYYNSKFEEKSNKEILISNNLFLSKKDNKYGYIDKSGKTVIDYIYDDATEQNKEGYSAVKKDGLWGSINKIGTEVLVPSVNLDNNIYSKFIDKWYLTENGLYYTK